MWSQYVSPHEPIHSILNKTCFFFFFGYWQDWRSFFKVLFMSQGQSLVGLHFNILRNCNPPLSPFPVAIPLSHAVRSNESKNAPLIKCLVQIGIVLRFCILKCIALFALRIVMLIYVFISLRPTIFKVGDCLYFSKYFGVSVTLVWFIAAEIGLSLVQSFILSVLLGVVPLWFLPPGRVAPADGWLWQHL